MLYNLPNGKTVEISLRQFLDLTDDQFDEEVRDLIAWNYGQDITDIFHQSVLKEGTIQNEEDLEEEILPDLTQLDSIDTFNELDFEPLD